MRLHLTLKEGASKAGVMEALRTATAAGAGKASPLFPEAPLPELSRFYTLEIRNRSAARKVAAALGQLDAVEAIGGDFKRKILRTARP